MAIMVYPMTKPAVNPAHILDSYRKSDAVIIVSQNNQGKFIQIEALNEQAEKITGLSAQQIVGQKLSAILPDRIQSTIAEYVDYKNEHQDLLSVLMKIRNFAVKGHTGQELGLHLRVIRGEEVERNPWFHLILEDEDKQRQAMAVRQSLKESFNNSESADTSSGLPLRNTILRNMDVVMQSVQSGQIKASFAVMDINNYTGLRSEHGDDFPLRLQRHIGHLCKQKLRPEDTVGTLNDRMLGLLLVDAAQEEARLVLNRLRWIVSVSPIEMTSKEISSQVNIGFAEIDGKISSAEVVEKCEAYAIGMRRKLVNTIELVVTHERRSGPRQERRKNNVPVDIDRRKKERRIEF